jgi:hypothetical protein
MTTRVQVEEISGRESQGVDAKTKWLAVNRQSYSNFDFDFDFDFDFGVTRSSSWVSERVGWWVSLVRELLLFSCCELLMLDTGSWGRGPFGKPEEGERSLLEAATEKRLGKNNEDKRRLRRLKCVL